MTKPKKPTRTKVDPKEVEAALERVKTAAMQLKETLDEVDEYKDRN